MGREGGERGWGGDGGRVALGRYGGERTWGRGWRGGEEVCSIAIQ